MTKKTEAQWSNQIVGWDNVDPTQLLANPLNFRRHPAAQREALRGSLNELGMITPVIVNRLTGNVLDGHARVEEYITAGVPAVPVAYVEVPPEKEGLALLSLDPIAAMAESDRAALDSLLKDAATGEEGLQKMFADMARDAEMYLSDVKDARQVGYIVQYGIVFDSEAQQETWFRFLRHLNTEYPGMETIAERLTAYIEGVVFSE